MGHRVMEHKKDRSSPQKKGRKESRKEDETGRIGKFHKGNPLIPLLSSVAKEQNNK